MMEGEKHSSLLIYFKNLVAIAYADGYLTEEEKFVLYSEAKVCGLADEELDKMLSTGVIQRGFIIPIVDDQNTADSQLEGMIRIAVADGYFDHSEFELIKRIGAYFYSELEIQSKITSVSRRIEVSSMEFTPVRRMYKLIAV